jgi:hypothetical protein
VFDASISKPGNNTSAYSLIFAPIAQNGSQPDVRFEQIAAKQLEAEVLQYAAEQFFFLYR